MELSLEHVSAVVVTAGDSDLGPVLRSLQAFDDVVVWDNSERENLKVYGRYAALAEAKHSLIYTQDDDCILDPRQVLEHYEPGKVVCNMPAAKREEYQTLAPKAGLVGWGSCFDRELAGALDLYLERFEKDDLFLRECDRVFTSLNMLKFADVPYKNLPCAYFASRMGNERRHLADLREINNRVASL